MASFQFATTAALCDEPEPAPAPEPEPEPLPGTETNTNDSDRSVRQEYITTNNVAVSMGHQHAPPPLVLGAVPDESVEEKEEEEKEEEDPEGRRASNDLLSEIDVSTGYPVGAMIKFNERVAAAAAAADPAVHGSGGSISDGPELCSEKQVEKKETWAARVQEAASEHNIRRRFDQIRDAMNCPISGRIFTDPVRVDNGTMFGTMYERKAIQPWLDHCAEKSEPLTDPVTGQELQTNKLIPDLSMSNRVRMYTRLEPALS
jgi:hypothetical protein